MKAGKHVYCEKPLTHSVAEARELRELARTCKVVTQMGNQGSASASLRRCTEIIKAGALGQIREIYQWGIGVTANEGSAAGRRSRSARLQLGPVGRAVGHAPLQEGRLSSLPLARLVRLRQRRPGRLLLPRHQPAHAGAGPGLSRADRRQHAGRQADGRQGRGGVPFPRARQPRARDAATGRATASRRPRCSSRWSTSTRTRRPAA